MAEDYTFEVDDKLQPEPARVFLYGPEGVGKTTWACGAPRPVLLSMGKGTGHIKGVPRIKRPGAKTSEIKTWDDLAWGVRALVVGKHDYGTVILDDATSAEELAIEAIIKAADNAKIKTLDDFGYGKGYVRLGSRIRNLRAGLDKCIERRNMNVVIVAHSRIKNFSNPDGPDYNRYAIALDEHTSEPLKQWATTILHMRFREVIETEGTGDKVRKGKQKVAKDRQLWCIRSDGKEAKNRYRLPETITAEDPAAFWTMISEFWKTGGAALAPDQSSGPSAAIPSTSDDDL